MNKHEAIEELKKHRVGFGDNTSIRHSKVLEIINQIHEPEKVVVPKFVAEWIEKHKNNNGKKYRLSHALEHIFDDTELGLYIKQQEGDYTETIARAWLDGYTVEQEKLYTVEIPDQNSYCRYRYLSRNDNGVCIDASNDAKWKQKRKNHFTESEIKQDFEWAWDAGFAKPVEAE